MIRLQTNIVLMTLALDCWTSRCSQLHHTLHSFRPSPQQINTEYKDVHCTLHIAATWDLHVPLQYKHMYHCNINTNNQSRIMWPLPCALMMTLIHLWCIELGTCSQLQIYATPRSWLYFSHTLSALSPPPHRRWPPWSSTPQVLGQRWCRISGNWLHVCPAQHSVRCCTCREHRPLVDQICVDTRKHLQLH